MKIKSIELRNFRNYDFLETQFNDWKNIIIGDNAQGKTNLIEAVYLCAFAKSFRSNNAAELVKIGEDSCYIKAIIESEEIEKKIEILINNKGKKMIKLDGKVLKRTADLLSNIVVIAFSPEDLRIIKDSPEKRRNYINREISQIRPKYYEVFHNYSEVLKQKNNVLKKIGFANSEDEKNYLNEMLDIFDSQLSNYGFEIMKMRRSFIELLNKYASEIQNRISSGKENLEISMKETACCSSKEEFFNLLLDNREKDINTLSSNLGPHRDDIEFKINGIDAKKYGSQGQQRTIALSLKLSEISIVKNTLGENPILLMDDVMSELDSDRQGFLVSEIEDVQLFITSTEIEEAVNMMEKITVFNIKSGKII